jgi:hypothetical protein
MAADIKVTILREVQTAVERCRVRLMSWERHDDADDAGLVADDLQEVMYKITGVLTALERAALEQEG